MKRNVFYIVFTISVFLCGVILPQKLRCQSSGSSFNPRIKASAKFIALNAVAATPHAFQEIVSVFGKNSGKTAIGIGFIISYLNMPPDKAAAKLRKYLTLSEQFNLPVIIQLDGEQWWGNRPDLWNWWDKTKPGYNPENKMNVEWSGWTSDSAVKIGWRNWGNQIRVLPMPNLMSPAYREACHTAMKMLIPIIMDWWHALPEEKRYLLIGIKVGWESAIGVNNWYYPNGNELLDEPEINDPTYGLKVDSLPDRGVEAIGYAAVSKLGLAHSGKLTEQELTKVVQVHLEDLCKVCAGLGVPRNKLFTHCGGWSKGETLYTAAVNRYSCPGWSFYDYASNPDDDVTAMAALKTSDAPYWGAVEWLYQVQNTEKGWKSALEKTLSTPGIRYLCIYNWSGIKDNQAAIKAIKSISNK